MQNTLTKESVEVNGGIVRDRLKEAETQSYDLACPRLDPGTINSIQGQKTKGELAQHNEADMVNVVAV